MPAALTGSFLSTSEEKGHIIEGGLGAGRLTLFPGRPAIKSPNAQASQRSNASPPLLSPRDTAPVGQRSPYRILWRSIMGRKLYVGNLTYAVTQSDLEQLFGQHGTVEMAQVITDRNTGQSKGFAF